MDSEIKLTETHPSRRDIMVWRSQGQCTALLHAAGSVSPPRILDLLRKASNLRHVFSQRRIFGARTTRPLHGLIWPKAGFASIAWPQRRHKTFFPWACRPFLATQESSVLPSSAALRLASECVADRLRHNDRHRGRGGRGLENGKGK